MKDLLEYVDFFKTLCEKHKELRHAPSNTTFFHLTMEEMLAKSKDTKSLPCVFLPTYDVSYGMNKADSMFEVLECNFYVLDKIDPKKLSEKDAVLNATKQIGDDFITKMMEAKRNGKLTGFEPETLNAVNRGPIMNDLYGWIFSFEITLQKNYQVNPEKWNE